MERKESVYRKEVRLHVKVNQWLLTASLIELYAGKHKPNCIPPARQSTKFNLLWIIFVKFILNKNIFDV